MLPGLRFLLAAVVLSASVLIFGLGAASLFRAAHEEFASIPARRPTPEPVFPQAHEAEPPPTLAMLRVDPPAEEKTPDSPEPAPAAPATDASPPTEPEQAAAVTADEAGPASAEANVADAPAAEPAPAEAEVPAPAEETKPASIAEAAPAPASEAASPATPEPAPAKPEDSPAASQVAALGSPAAAVEDTRPAKSSSAKPDQSARKLARPERSKERRRVVRRPRPAPQATIAQQQPVSPFAPQPLFFQPTR